MASSSFSSRSSCTRKYVVTLLLVFSTNIQKITNCNAFQTFGFEMHHRYSDQVKSIMGGDNLPEKGSLQYYTAMVHRDKVFRGRALAENNEDNSKLLTFSEGNQSFYLPLLGYLHYAYVTLGIPSLSFLVALDTGSDLFWVPCDCTSCVRNLVTSYGAYELNFKIYSSNSSATSKAVPCNNSLCELQRECSESSGQCPYRVEYRENTSSSGVLVEDVLHLIIEDHEQKDIDARITFGCQSNSVLSTGAPNGLFGLGMGNTSVPSILSTKGLIANSFSMCFGFDGVGRINFGDKGSSDQDETPFNLTQTHYEVSVTKLSVGRNLSDLRFSAIFDSGSSVTHLNDPAYTAICEGFDAQALHKRIPSDPGNPFEYCYEVRLNSAELFLPNVTLIMEGGSQFNIYDAIALTSNGTATIYCLAVVKSPDVNIIGQNFMTGYRIVFNREQMVLGWKPFNCYEIVDPSTEQKIPQITKESPTTANVQRSRRNS
ncbi:aspartyl protease family protein 1-like [Papaver somniferum]|uniref:aspartyl protease family protein 1-like n=1 Tax=Papaver somniferum TaxID=3469 RepID=UPI000E6FB097|nr:aspartyl protease family protein 1-like [Papaver somniferum]